MEDLSEIHQKILKSFRYSVEDVMEPEHDDHFLLRFLRARNFDEEKAEIMFRKSMEWRKRLRIRNFLEHYRIPELFQRYHPGGLIGHDKEGSPVWIMNFGRIDIKGFQESDKTSEFVKFQVYRLELTIKEMKEQSKKLNRKIDKAVFILDLENLIVSQVLSKPVLESLLHTLRVFEANYPEILKICYVINAPQLFLVLFSFIKPILSDNTAKKVKIFGTEGWKAPLLQIIDSSVLPAYWGGVRVEPVTGEPWCPSQVNMGGPVHESVYIRNRKGLEDESDVASVIVPKRNYVDLTIEVNEIGSVIEWEVKTKQGDISIGLLKKCHASDELVELLPCIKEETSKVAELGSYECECAGEYFLRLDNTFSWFIAKKVTYRLRVIPPKKNDS